MVFAVALLGLPSRLACFVGRFLPLSRAAVGVPSSHHMARDWQRHPLQRVLVLLGYLPSYNKQRLMQFQGGEILVFLK